MTRLRGLFFALLLAGCLPPAQTGSPSARVERGELYRPGKTPYDEFFVSVHDLQVEMAGVADDRRAARSSLTQSLGLLPTAAPERVVEVLKDRVAEVKKGGGRFTASGNIVTAEGKVTPDARTIAQGLSSCLAGERSIADRMSKMPERADGIAQHEPPLTQSADADFPMMARGQVKAELLAARRVLAQIAENAKTAAKTSNQHADDLARIALSGAAATKPAATPVTTTSPPRKPAGGTPPVAAPPPTAPPPPPSGNDFNP